MPLGNPKIQEVGKTFSTEYQPVNRRKSTKFLTALLTKNLNKNKELIVEGTDIKTGLPTKIKISMPTKDVIVQALLRQAAKGNMIAIKEVFDRLEGKSIQSVELKNEEGESFNITLNLAPK